MGLRGQDFSCLSLPCDLDVHLTSWILAACSNLFGLVLGLHFQYGGIHHLYGDQCVQTFNVEVGRDLEQRQA